MKFRIILNKPNILILLYFPNIRFLLNVKYCIILNYFDLQCIQLHYCLYICISITKNIINN